MANPRNPGESQADADKRATDEANRNRQNERQSPQPVQHPAPKE